jgi:hypothetical protein
MYSKAILDRLGFKRGDRINLNGASYLLVSVEEEGLQLVTTGALFNSAADLDKRVTSYAFLQPYDTTETLTQADRVLKERRTALKPPCVLSEEDALLFSTSPDVSLIARSDTEKFLYIGSPENVIGITDLLSIARDKSFSVMRLPSTTDEQIKSLLVAEPGSGVTPGFTMQSIQVLSARFYQGKSDVSVMTKSELKWFSHDLPEKEFALYTVDHRSQGFVVQTYKPNSQQLWSTTFLLVRKGINQAKAISDWVLDAFKFFIGDHADLVIHGLPEEGASDNDAGPAPAEPGIGKQRTQWFPVGSDSTLNAFADLGREQDNDLLPDMTGFEPHTLGADANVWRSPGYLLADRDLAEGEQVRVWVVRVTDGKIVKEVVYTAPSTQTVEQWPREFLAAVNAAPANLEAGKLLLGGRVVATGAMEIGDAHSPTTQALKDDEALFKADLNRLWCYGCDHRLFTNAPFATNLVVAAWIPNKPLPEDRRVVVQVRDRTTLHLYETHLLAPATEEDQASVEWTHELCTLINATGGMLRAGRREGEQAVITPGQTDNALWIPQCSDLTVEVDQAGWRRHRVLESFEPVAGATVWFRLYDSYSGVHLPGSPFSYTFDAKVARSTAGLTALADALKASALGPYLRLAGLSEVGELASLGSDWGLWVITLPVRVVVSGVGSVTDEYEEALTSISGKTLNLDEVYRAHPQGMTLAIVDRWNGFSLATWTFRPANDAATDISGWVSALRNALSESGSEVGALLAWRPPQDIDPGPQVESVMETLWLPRDLECQLEVRAMTAPTESKSAAPQVGKTLTFLRDGLVIDEVFTYLEARKGYGGSAKLFAWGGDVVSQEEYTKLRAFNWNNYTNRYNTLREEDRKAGFSPLYWINPDSPYYLNPKAFTSSLNVGALVASRLSQSDITISKKDTWFLGLPDSKWMKALSGSGTSLVLALDGSKAFSGLRTALLLIHGYLYLNANRQRDRCADFLEFTRTDIEPFVHEALHAVRHAGVLGPAWNKIVEAYEAQVHFDVLIEKAWRESQWSRVYGLPEADMARFTDFISDPMSVLKPEGNWSEKACLFYLIEGFDLRSKFVVELISGMSKEKTDGKREDIWLSHLHTSIYEYEHRLSRVEKNIELVAMLTKVALPTVTMPKARALIETGVSIIAQWLKREFTVAHQTAQASGQLAATPVDAQARDAARLKDAFNILSAYQAALTKLGQYWKDPKSVSYSAQNVGILERMKALSTWADIQTACDCQLVSYLRELALNLEEKERCLSFHAAGRLCAENKFLPTVSFKDLTVDKIEAEHKVLLETIRAELQATRAAEAAETFQKGQRRIAERLVQPDIATACQSKDANAIFGLLADSTAAHMLQLTLTPEALRQGIKILGCDSGIRVGKSVFKQFVDFIGSCPRHTSGLDLYIPEAAKLHYGFALASASYIDENGITPACYNRFEEVTPLCINPPIKGRRFIPPDTLCADYANTVASELYDVSGATENGVDPRTGLFHAHYPVGTVCGLSGEGPILDLTLHYSATRANESALGDGWAFRFSAYDNYLQRLTLSTGQTITLKAEHIDQAKGSKRLAMQGVTLTGASGNADSLNTLTIVYPSGRIEQLGKPASSTGQGDTEPNSNYKKAMAEKLNKFKEQLEQWLKESATTKEQAVAIKEKITSIESLKKSTSRKAFSLVPTVITSPQGGSLNLEWEGLSGHVRLLSIRDGEVELLKAKHGKPVADGTYHTTFTVWGASHEEYRVDLTIKDCLLTQLSRIGKGQAHPVQTVRFEYEGEPVLDRVLYAITEEDGSLEHVSYAPVWEDWESDSSSIPLSRVVRHTLVPGAGQPPISHTWHYEGLARPVLKEGDRIVATQTLEVPHSLAGPFLSRTWTLRNGFTVETESVDSTPGVVRETTTYQYSDASAITDTSLRFRLATQPISVQVVTEDLRPNTALATVPPSLPDPSRSEIKP